MGRGMSDNKIFFCFGPTDQCWRRCTQPEVFLDSLSIYRHLTNLRFYSASFMSYQTSVPCYALKSPSGTKRTYAGSAFGICPRYAPTFLVRINLGDKEDSAPCML